MTREEAIKRLKEIDIRDALQEDYDALYMAIKALEQEPCEDAISRQYLIEKATNWEKHFHDSERYVSLTDIQNAPPVRPQEPFDIDTYCKEHFMVMVDKDVWDKAEKALEQESKWISVNERLPEELEPVNITWVNHDPESYYADIKDKPFTATGVHFNGQWYWWSTLCTDILAEYSHNYDDVIDDDIEITAWMPLPKPYEPQEGRKYEIRNKTYRM